MKRRGSSILGEMGSIVRNRKVLISVSAVMLVPLLYSFMFLWAFWDPYAKMDSLPVAVVNMDEGSVLDGKNISVGEEFSKKLKESNDFEWHFVSKEKAREGLSNRDFYMAIEIPEDFSAKAASMMGDHPTQAVFRFIPNESANFLASQIGKSAVDRIQSKLSAQLTETYTKTLFDGLDALKGGFVKAAEGASRLSDGTASLEQGAQALKDNLAKLMQGTGPLNDGISKLVEGSNQLSAASVQLSSGAARLSGGLQETSTGAEALKTGAGTVAAGLEQLAAAHPEWMKDPSFVQLVEGSKRVSGGLAQLSRSLAQLSQGGQVLEAGAEQLVPGTAQLTKGLDELSTGMGTLSNGAAELSNGSEKLLDGAQAVSSGAQALASGLDGATARTASLEPSEERNAVFANPVAFEEEKFTEVPNYGTGFSPYFLSLGLFVGALLLTIVFPMKNPAVAPKSGVAWFAGKAATMMTIGLLQALIMDAVLLWGLGIHTQNVGLFLLFSVLTSWTFMALIQFLVTLFGDPGRFVAIVILILQLTGSAGTFPIELTPSFFQDIYAWLPMTHSVQGFKAVISSGDISYLWANAGKLCGYIASFSVMTFAYFVIAFKKNKADSRGKQTVAA